MSRSEARLRRFLLAVSALILAATIVELLLEEHTESTLQLVPFALCAAGLVVVIGVLVANRPPMRRALRIVMTLVAIGSLVGIYLHIDHNVAFELEIRPGATPADVLGDALMGASPLLAPGITAIAALLAVAAVYRERDVAGAA